MLVYEFSLTQTLSENPWLQPAATRYNCSTALALVVRRKRLRISVVVYRIGASETTDSVIACLQKGRNKRRLGGMEGHGRGG